MYEKKDPKTIRFFKPKDRDILFALVVLSPIWLWIIFHSWVYLPII
jgi:hypothetical protein